jgi:hypothetical protein
MCKIEPSSCSSTRIIKEWNFVGKVWHPIWVVWNNPRAPCLGYPLTFEKLTSANTLCTKFDTPKSKFVVTYTHFANIGSIHICFDFSTIIDNIVWENYFVKEKTTCGCKQSANHLNQILSTM